jgi:hypothetical protein
MSQVAKRDQRPPLVLLRIFEMRSAQFELAMNAAVAAMSLELPYGVLVGRYVFGVFGGWVKLQPRF